MFYQHHHFGLLVPTHLHHSLPSNHSLPPLFSQLHLTLSSLSFLLSPPSLPCPLFTPLPPLHSFFSPPFSPLFLLFLPFPPPPLSFRFFLPFSFSLLLSSSFSSPSLLVPPYVLTTPLLTIVPSLPECPRLPCLPRVSPLPDPRGCPLQLPVWSCSPDCLQGLAICTFNMPNLK